MKNIIRKEATITAEGEHTNRNAKMVVCVTNGKKFHSVIDAAEYAGCHYSMMCGHLSGKFKTCKGKKYRYANDGAALMEELTANIQTLTQDAEDAKRWREYQASIEAERKAEEKRLADIAKAEEKIAHSRAMAEKSYQKYLEALDKVTEAENELDALRGTEE